MTCDKKSYLKHKTRGFVKTQISNK